MKSLLIKWTGFPCCLLNTVAIELCFCKYSFQEQVESLSQDELKKLLSRMLEYQPDLVMTLLEKGDPEQGYQLNHHHLPNQTGANAPIAAKCRQKERENAAVM